MITIRMNLLARQGKQLELVQVIDDLKQKIALEDGCIGCHVYQSTENSNEFVVFEEWKNENQAQAHLKSDNLAVLVGAGSVLTRKVNVSLGNEPSTPLLAESFEERVAKKVLSDFKSKFK